jgi:hypothetical protein
LQLQRRLAELFPRTRLFDKPQPGTFAAPAIWFARATKSGTSMRTQLSKRIPVLVTLAVVVFGVVAMLVVDHGPWSGPKVRTAEVHTTTTGSARAAGAMVTPTMRQSDLEPVAPGPRPVERATIPATR